MSEEGRLEDSLASWVPPWQRVTKPEPTGPAAPDAGAGDSDAGDSDGSDAFGGDAHGGDAYGGDPGEAEAADRDEAIDEAADLAAVTDHGAPAPLDEQSGEIVDTLEDLAYAPDEGGDGDDEPQRPETDIATGQDWHGARLVDEDVTGGDEDDEPQRPETDIWPGSAAPDLDRLSQAATGGGSDEDEPQRPETDVAGMEAGDEGLTRPADLRGAIEAILMVVDEPVGDDVLAGVLDVTTGEVIDELIALAADYDAAGRGFQLRRVAGGWRLYTRAEFSAYVERFVLDGQSVRLTQAALETLAVVAYQQPVTRSRMAAIRGVSCDGVVRTLVSRGLIEECGTQPESGAYLYQTTQMFLEKLGLDSLEDLPPLAPFLPDDVNGLVDAER